MGKMVQAIVSGEVQGVGYRYTVYQIAKKFNITGFVRNLDDGTVEVVAEGEEEELKQFINAISIKDDMIRVEHVAVEWKPAENKFSNFSIIRSGFV
ncbi:MAG: acylphosphatase [Candidatus Micrarchaeota archaeon]